MSHTTTMAVEVERGKPLGVTFDWCEGVGLVVKNVGSKYSEARESSSSDGALRVPALLPRKHLLVSLNGFEVTAAAGMSFQSGEMILIATTLSLNSLCSHFAAIHKQLSH